MPATPALRNNATVRRRLNVRYAMPGLQGFSSSVAIFLFPRHRRYRNARPKHAAGPGSHQRSRATEREIPTAALRLRCARFFFVFLPTAWRVTRRTAARRRFEAPPSSLLLQAGKEKDARIPPDSLSSQAYAGYSPDTQHTFTSRESLRADREVSEAIVSVLQRDRRGRHALTAQRTFRHARRTRHRCSTNAI